MKPLHHVAITLLLLAPSASAGQPATQMLAGSADFRDTVRIATGKVFPAVVFVRCIRDSYDSGKKQAEAVSGSGVLISPRGELLTNWHVVDKAVEVRCMLHDGQAMAAKVVGTDKDTDLALLQLDLPAAAPDLPYAILGDSDRLEAGDFAMAMGAPWGLSRSVSIGIISCTRRYLPEHSEYSLWLQTDCAISPGNSGGPLVNTEGELIGINSRGYLLGGDMAFAVPSATVRFVVSQLRAQGQVEWSWTGLQLQPLRDFNRDMYFEGDEGVVVVGTDVESPARRAGFQQRDRILAVADTPTSALTDEDLPAIRALLGRLPTGTPADVTVLRGTERIHLELTPRRKGDVEGKDYDCKRWDMTVKSINQFDNPALYFHRREGVFVYSTKSPGNADDAGLQDNDIILQIDGQAVQTLEDVRSRHEQSLASIESKHKIVITVLRNGLMRQIVLDFLPEYDRE